MKTNNLKNKFEALNWFVKHNVSTLTKDEINGFEASERFLTELKKIENK